MGLFLTKRPGRYVRNCIVAAVDPCDSLTQADWNKIAWILSGGGFGGVYVLPNLVDGLIASIDSYPSGGYYNSSGVKIADLTYNSGLGYYTTATEINPNNTDYVQIENIPVTLNDGSTCTLDYTQIYNNTVAPPAVEPEFSYTTTDLSPFFDIDGSIGTVDWGDGTIVSYDASSLTQNLSHTYSGAGTRLIQVFNDRETTELVINGTGMTSLDLLRATKWTNLNIGNNASLTQILWPQQNLEVIDIIEAVNISLSGTLNLLFSTNLGGAIDFDNGDLDFVIFPNSSQVITELRFKSNNLGGNVSAGGLTGLSGAIDFGGNILLTGFICPPSSGVISKFDFAACDLSYLDLSPLTGLGGSIDIGQNSNMTYVLFPTSSEIVTKLDLVGSGINQDIDLSGMTGLGGDLQFQTNNSVTDIIFPTSSVAISDLIAYNMDSLTDIDITGLTNLTGDVRFSGNNSQTRLRLPATSGTMQRLRLYSNDLGYEDMSGLTFQSTNIEIRIDSNSMTATEVNHWLVDMDTVLGTGTGTIKTDGSNAAPDGTSGGYDGLTAKANLISKGYTVTTN